MRSVPTLLREPFVHLVSTLRRRAVALGRLKPEAAAAFAPLGIDPAARSAELLALTTDARALWGKRNLTRRWVSVLQARLRTYAVDVEGWRQRTRKHLAWHLRALPSDGAEAVTLGQIDEVLQDARIRRPSAALALLRAVVPRLHDAATAPGAATLLDEASALLRRGAVTDSDLHAARRDQRLATVAARRARQQLAEAIAEIELSWLLALQHAPTKVPALLPRTPTIRLARTRRPQLERRAAARRGAEPPPAHAAAPTPTGAPAPREPAHPASAPASAATPAPAHPASARRVASATTPSATPEPAHPASAPAVAPAATPTDPPQPAIASAATPTATPAPAPPASAATATPTAAPPSTPPLNLDDATALARLLMAGVAVTPTPTGWRGEQADRTIETATLTALWRAIQG